MGTIKRLVDGLGTVIFLPKFILDKDSLENQVKRYKEFILFFERSIRSNIEMMLQEIKECLMENDYPVDGTEILLTPLVMDFDIVLRDEMKEEFGKQPTVKQQYKRIGRALSSSDYASIPNTKVCPFIGFDLRKLNDGKIQGFKDFWATNNTLGKSKISDLESGKLLGIKLYPPLGFNPWPEDYLDEHKEFYTWCCSKDIPLTTHCQKESYSIGQSKKDVDKNTSPENWKRVLGNPDFRNLRINFAHFGGETGADDMFEPFRIDKDSWTYILIKLLKTYPNTYADISAYDYTTEEHRGNLIKIFEEDKNGNFGNGYKLTDKLLWGSDVPMIISEKSYRKGKKIDGESRYKYYFAAFKETIASSDVLNGEEKESIITNMTEINPKKFLRIL